MAVLRFAFANVADVKDKYVLYKDVVTLHIMFRFVLLCMLWFVAAATCSVEHKTVWTCILKDACVNKYQLHASIRKKTHSLRRQFLMAVEGAQYHRLFDDCDANRDGCISMDDILSAGEPCQRSCTWRTTMYDLLC